MRVKTSADRRLKKKIAGLNGLRSEQVKIVATFTNLTLRKLLVNNLLSW